MPHTQVATPTGKLLNRELSWLEFNARVLALAEDPDVPLLERVRFCSIFSNNLDEFFSVRIAGLLDQAASGLVVRSPDGLTPREALAAIRTRITDLTQRQSKLWKRELSPALADEGIRLAAVDELSDKELREIERTFEASIFPVLTPLGVGPGQPFPFISPLSLSLAVLARDNESGEERFGRVKVPEGLPRFVEVGKRGALVPMEALIAHFLPWLFPGMEIAERAAFRVTRDADFEVSDEADDLLEAVQEELRRRRFGEVVRLEVSSSMSESMLARLREGLDVAPDLVYPVHGLLDLADVDGGRPPRPAGPQGRAVGAGDELPLPPRRERRAERLRRDPPRRHPRAPAVRVVRDELRDVPPRVVARLQRGHDQDDGLPHLRRVAAGPGAHRGRRGGAAERLPRRAQGALRRARQHRVGARARAGGRARGLRLPESQDPREDDPDRPPRRRAHAALRPRRHRQLPLGDRAPLRGRRALHRGRGHLRRRRRPLQLPDGLRAAAAVPQDPRRPAGAASPPRGRDPGVRRRPPRPASRRGSGSRSTTSPTRR